MCIQIIHVMAKSSISEMCRKAIDLDIEEIGFSEHMDFEPEDLGFEFFNYKKYTSEIMDTQSLFETKLVIHKGVEIDYQYCFQDVIKEWLRDRRFDFIIGSVYYLDHEIISHQMVAEKDLRGIYDAYFKELHWSIEKWSL